MWKNKEIRKGTYVYGIMVLGCLLISLITNFLIGFLCVACIAYVLFFIYTKQRYQEVEKLCVYLQKVYQGVQYFEVQEYAEGELSILKSDIYKIIHILRQQADELRKDKHFLANALSDISHQIKTPLTSIMVMSDLLEEELPQEKKMEFIVQMREQMKRLQWLISSLLKISKIDANAITFHKEQIALHEVIQHALEPFQILIELKHQECIVACDESIFIVGDKNWLSEAFANLIKNSLEHTAEGSSIEIKVQETPLHTRVVFMDCGSGISEEDLPHIFERFYRGKNAASDSVGIGLALSRSICIQHNASIEVTSKNHEGTTFTITFYK
ncbi:sensor histidine kinase [Amedibacillus sp. YH-ame6]